MASRPFGASAFIPSDLRLFALIPSYLPSGRGRAAVASRVIGDVCAADEAGFYTQRPMS